MVKIKTDSGEIDVSQEEFDRLSRGRLPFTGGDIGTDVLTVGQSIGLVPVAAIGNVDKAIKAAVSSGKILKADIPADVLALNRVDTANLADLGFRAGRSSILNQLDDLERFILNSGNVPTVKSQVLGASAKTGAKLLSKLKDPRVILTLMGLHAIGVQQGSEVFESRAFNARELADAVIFQDMDPDEAIGIINQQKGDIYETIVEGLVSSGIVNPLSVLTTFPAAAAKVQAGKEGREIALKSISAEAKQDKEQMALGTEEDQKITESFARSQAVGQFRRDRELEKFGALGTKQAKQDKEIQSLRDEEQKLQIDINTANITKELNEAKTAPRPLPPASAEEAAAMQSLPPTIAGKTQKERAALQSAPPQFTEEELKRKQSRR